MKLLSVIIPTYNMENYLPRCLDSLIKNPKILEYIQILVINDGSKDKSSEIAHRYANQYPNSIEVIDKENGNYGSCINRGIKEATGKYVKVLDADDSFCTDGLSEVIQCLKSEKLVVDMVITNYIVNNTQTRIQQHISYQLPKNQELSFDNPFIARKLYGIQMHAIIYRTDLLKEIDYKQTEGISYTDQEWCFYPMIKVNTIRYLDITLYDYLIGREGQTMSLASMKKMISHLVIVAKRMLNYFSSLDKNKISKSRYLYLEHRVLVRYKDIYRFYLVILRKNEFTKSEFKALDQDLKNKSKILYTMVGIKSVLKRTVPIPYVILYRLFRIRL